MEPIAAEACPPSLCESSDLILSFVNTRDVDSGPPGPPGNRAGLAEWLARVGRPDRDLVVTNADTVAADELRSTFVTIFRAHAGCADSDTSVSEAEAYLHRIAERYPLTAKISSDGCTLVPAQTGVPGAFGALFAAAADLAGRGGWSRLKVCKNPTCHTGFFDKTRNSSGLYCSTACGSQMSMRAYRSRRKNG
ncbi:CGNR zinc finger domain-containing protein [Plantactinospora soyae]|uniref:RNA-binding Zn ribbon-like protein n=1 Tax=Plantactinospora soyae TaxID=1544732 RepID=A0A927M122_9ACTN|nr:CGNR zinc finger domain-containing protein [Plantactinospora soyae]MBE1484842.1 putative RNA-binding Zn ribbon-like protein [Plantactinospora soyae]